MYQYKGTFRSAVLDYAKVSDLLVMDCLKSLVNGLGANEKQNISLPLCGTIEVFAYSEESKALFGISQY